jgi:hypothetical protein
MIFLSGSGQGLALMPLASALIAHTLCALLAVVFQMMSWVLCTLDVGSVANVDTLNQVLNVLDVKVGLQGGDSGRRDRRHLSARRALNLLSNLADVFAQAIFAEGVMTGQELWLVVAVIEQ